MLMRTLEFAEVPIDSVAVYLTGAELSRQVELAFETAGCHAVKVLLPGNDADLSTVRAAISGGTAKADIVKLDSGVDEWTFYNRLDRYPEAKPLYDEFLRLCKAHQLLRGESMGLAVAIGNVEKMLRYLCSDKCPMAVADFDSHCKLMREARTQTHALSQRQQEVQRLMKVSQAEVIAMCHKLNVALKMGFCVDPAHAPVTWLRNLNNLLVQPNSIDNRTWITLSIQVHEPGTANLQVSYLANNATWRPAYDFRIATGQDEELDLTYFAFVSQTTGEDWKNVAVSLHAGSPSTAGGPPGLSPLTVRVKEQPKPHKPMAARMVMKAAAVAPESAAVEDECCDDEGDMGYALMDSAPATNFAAVRKSKKRALKAHVREGSEVQAAFDIPKRWDIESSPHDHRFVITQATLKCNILNYCSPEASPTVFRAARVQNTTGCIMMAAPAAVYWDGSLIATTQLKTVAPGDHFEAFFGEDERVRIEVRPEKTNNKTRGVLQQSTVRESAHTLTLRNQRDQPMRVMIVYRLPVSTCAAISVVPEVGGGTSIKKWEGESDLEAVDELSASDKTEWLHNTITDHCITLIKVGGQSQTAVVFKYYVENSNKNPIIISP